MKIQLIPLRPTTYALLLLGAISTALIAPPCFADSADAQSQEALLKRAFTETRGTDPRVASMALADALTRNKDETGSRRYNAFQLLKENNPKGALQQLEGMKLPDGFDFFMKGMAGEMMGNPLLAAECFKTAVQLDPTNNVFRRKAIDSLIVMSEYTQATALCADGRKIAGSETARAYYEHEREHCQELTESIAKDRPCIKPARH